MKTWPVEKKVFGGFAAALLVLTVVGSLAFYNGAMAITSNRMVGHTHEVLAQLNLIYSTVQDAESGQRGYLLTAKESYLAPYHTAVNSVNSRLATLHELTKDNPRQTARVADLQGRIELRLHTLEETLNIRDTDGYEAAVRAVASGRGQRQMEDVRALVGEMQAEERRLLEERTAASDASARATILTSTSSVFLVAILLGIAYRVIKLDMAKRKRAELAVQESEERFRRLSNASREGVCIHENGTILEANKRLAEMFGYEPHEVIGREMWDFTPPEYQNMILSKALMEDESPYELVGVRKDGSLFPIEVHGQTVPYQGRQARVTTTRDLTDRKQAEAALKQSEREYRGLFENAHDAILLVSVDQEVVLDANAAACKLYGLKREELLGVSIAQLSKDHSGLSESDVKRLEAGSTVQYESVHRGKGGVEMDLEITAALVEYKGQRAYLRINRDVTERKRAEEALHVLATQDGLTGLLNRREMDRVLAEEVTRCRRYRHALSLVMIDIDHFKLVNDHYGHKVGDEVLRWIGGIFRNGLRTTDRVARYGGEEMAVILPETGEAEACLVAERFRATVSAQPFIYMTPGGELVSIPVTISLGVAEFPSHASAADALVVAADNALYYAKRSGRNQVASYTVSARAAIGDLVLW